jgi:hypothetical protein
MYNAAGRTASESDFRLCKLRDRGYSDGTCDVNRDGHWSWFASRSRNNFELWQSNLIRNGRENFHVVGFVTGS